MSVIFAPIISYLKKSIDKIVKKQLRLIVFTFSAVIFMLFGVFFVVNTSLDGVLYSRCIFGCYRLFYYGYGHEQKRGR
jgi:hypothetical protein